MTFEIEIGGRSRSVSVQRTGSASRYRVAVDGCTHLVDARRSGGFGLLLASATFPPKIASVSADNPYEHTSLGPQTGNDSSASVKSVSILDNGVAPTYEIFVAPGTNSGELLVTIEGRSALAVVNGRKTVRVADTARQTRGHGEQTVVAPMPGRVVRVLVGPGDEVAARQGVIVVEAMKMENELRAPKGGRVKDVSVSAGNSVEAGRVLMIIE
jgi:biotin carboxyl carrier protein